MERLAGSAPTRARGGTRHPHPRSDVGARNHRRKALNCLAWPAAARIRSGVHGVAAAREALAGSAAGILAVEGGWYITVRMPRIRSEEDWAIQLLAQEGVLTQPGFFYDFESEAFLIVSLLTLPEVFREGIRRLRRAVE